MPSPVRPSEFSALIPSGTSNLCDRLLRVFIQLPQKISDWVSWMFNEDGTFTDNFLNQASLVPPGMVMARASSATPHGWLACNGTEVSRTTYITLFEAIGTAFGAGDGSTTFNVPNLQDKFVLGSGGTRDVADNGGEETHVLSASEAQPGTLNVDSASMNKCAGGSSTENLHSFFLNGVQIGGHVHDGVDMTDVDVPLGTGTANDPHNNMPPWVALRYFIKT